MDNTVNCGGDNVERQSRKKKTIEDILLEDSESEEEIEGFPIFSDDEEDLGDVAHSEDSSSSESDQSDSEEDEREISEREKELAAANLPQWTEAFHAPEKPEFTQQVGPSHDIRNGTALDYFLLFFPLYLIDILVEETNRQVLLSVIKSMCRIVYTNQFHPTT